MNNKILIGSFIGVICALLIVVEEAAVSRARDSGAGPLQTIEWKLYDWQMVSTARPTLARADIALIEIDEYSLRNLEPAFGRWPWPRAAHAMLLNYLTRAGARVILYDVNFAEDDSRGEFAFGDTTLSGAASDAIFSESVRAAGNVVLIADATYQAKTGGVPAVPDQGVMVSGEGILERPVVFPPFTRLAGSASGLAHNLFVLDADGPMRHVVPFVRNQDTILPSLGVAAALRAGDVSRTEGRVDGTHLRIGDLSMPVQRHRVRDAAGTAEYLWALVFFRGPPLLGDLKSRPYAHYPAFDLVLSEQQLLAGEAPMVDPALFKDKLVFIGVTAAGLFDVFETPFAGGRMPGIQIHAAVADDLLSRRFIAPAPWLLQLAVLTVVSASLGVAATMLPTWWAAGLAVAVIALCVAGATAAFSAGWWFSLATPASAGVMALLVGGGRQYLVEGREKRRIRALFGRYVSKDVCDQLIADPAQAALGGKRRLMTVLFSDLRGFTTLSEAQAPEDVVAMLNEYFTEMVTVVLRHHGTVDKFVGDMVMALFGAPLKDPHHAEHAADAALEMVAELERLNERWRIDGRPPLALGIGISTGQMVVGNLGSDVIMSYTVIGDAVNLGARLESLNKDLGTTIIISAATREALPERYGVRPLPVVPIKGKKHPVQIFELTSRP